jgi:hypothetical protein
LRPSAREREDFVFHSGERTGPVQAGAGVPARLLCALLLCGQAGCGFWDEFRANDYSIKAFFAHEDPLVVLRDSNDGTKRARALGALREPKQHGGSEDEQKVVVDVLVAAASKEPQALCRMRAIETLATFKDPRAVKGLEDAYYAAKDFNPEHRTIVRCQALDALGRVGNPTAVDLLVTVIKAPPPEPTANSEDDKQHYTDERIAAARALQHFKHYQATEALVHVLKTEKKDTALRGRAHESLQVVTGKRLPPDAQAWDELLHPPGAPATQDALANQPKKAATILSPILQTGGRGGARRP